MTIVRLTHTPCAQPVQLTDDNRILEPDTDLEHQCPVIDGRYSVVKHWARWSVEDVLDVWKPQPIYNTQAEAQAEADKRNRAHHRTTETR